MSEKVPMLVLVACEESQRVCAAFRAKGHEAYSCDILEPSGGHPEWHVLGDALVILNGGDFQTMDGVYHHVVKWDMVIAHPPCTYLTVAGNRWFSEKYGEKAVKRRDERENAAQFFMRFVNADCEKIVIENPVGWMNKAYRAPDQIIHPYYFAESVDDGENYVQKRTCLWLKGVQPLQRLTQLPTPQPMYLSQGEKTKGKAIGWCEGLRGCHGGRSRARSKTFHGIAKAMAESWG